MKIYSITPNYSTNMGIRRNLNADQPSMPQPTSPTPTLSFCGGKTKVTMAAALAALIAVIPTKAEAAERRVVGNLDHIMQSLATSLRNPDINYIVWIFEDAKKATAYDFTNYVLSHKLKGGSVHQALTLKGDLVKNILLRLNNNPDCNKAASCKQIKGLVSNRLQNRTIDDVQEANDLADRVDEIVARRNVSTDNKFIDISYEVMGYLDTHGNGVIEKFVNTQKAKKPR